MDLPNVELMVEGTHNDVEFRVVPDFQSMVSSFDTLELSGRLPIKFGHGDTEKDQPFREGMPALGWIERVWIEGNKLMADFVDVPKVVYDAIKAGLYRFVSVELLRNVKAGTRIIPWVLDGVALLGADPPAVGSLKDLQSLTTMSRGLKLQAESRFTFSLGGNTKTMSDENKLRIEVRKLTRDLITTEFNHAIQSGRILPAERERFIKRYGEEGTVELAREWISTAPKPQGYSGPQSGYSPERVTAGRPDEEVVRLTEEYRRQHRKDFGEALDYQTATKHVLKENPTLAERYKTMPDDIWG